jgi:hypothetical protein
MPYPHTAAVDLSSLLDGSSAEELIPEMDAMACSS